MRKNKKKVTLAGSPMNTETIVMVRAKMLTNCDMIIKGLRPARSIMKIGITDNGNLMTVLSNEPHCNHSVYL